MKQISMNDMPYGKAKSITWGFSLAELMIVILVTAILAAIAIPIYSKNVYNAKRAEAMAAMGSIKSQINMYYGEHGWYPIVSKEDYVIGAYWNDIRPGELRGMYFSDSAYLYKSKNGDKWELKIKKKESWLEDDLKLKSDGSWKGHD